MDENNNAKLTEYETKENNIKTEDTTKQQENISEKKSNIDPSKNKIYMIISILLSIILVSSAIHLYNNNNNLECTGNACIISSDITGNAVISNKDVVAEFNGNKIYSDELDKAYDLFLFSRGIPKIYSSTVPKIVVLNQTIIQRLLYDKATTKGFDANKDETEYLLSKALVNSGNTIDEFKKQFENASFDYSDFIELNRQNIAINKLFNQSFSSIKITEDEAKEYYEQNKDSFKIDESVQASHILVNTSEEAMNIIAQLDSGANFAEIAKEKSIDPSAASNEGDLGFFGKGMMVPEFEDVAFAMKNIGEYTKEPVKTQFGYHIILLTGRKEAEEKTYDDVKDEIQQLLLQQKQNEVVNEHIAQLLKDAQIKIYLTENETKQ